MLKRPAIIAAILLVQGVCAGFFVWQILLSVLGVQTAPIPWRFYELIEIGAAVGLVLGVVLGAIGLRLSLRRASSAEAQLLRASGAFLDLVEERFGDWGLTPAERDVALFALKGFTTGEIASFRETSEGTVKAQTAAIYRKAGVGGRSHLISLFVEDLMSDEALADRRAASGG